MQIYASFGVIIQYLEYSGVTLDLNVDGIELICIFQMFLEIYHTFYYNFLFALELFEHFCVVFIHDMYVNVFSVILCNALLSVTNAKCWILLCSACIASTFDAWNALRWLYDCLFSCFFFNKCRIVFRTKCLYLLKLSQFLLFSGRVFQNWAL